jgi:hypothetical protein
MEEVVINTRHRIKNTLDVQLTKEENVRNRILIRKIIKG